MTIGIETSPALRTTVAPLRESLPTFSSRKNTTMAREYDTPRTVSLEINVRLAALGRKQAGHLPAAAYAFARSGQLIDKLVLRTSGCARLNLPDLRVM